jgi:hypothetical protein
MRASACWFVLPALFPAASLAAGVFDGVPVGGQVALPAFAVEGAKHSPGAIVFERIDPYAPGARIYEVGAGGALKEVPRSPRRWFVSDRDRSLVRMYLSVSEDGKTFTGTWFDAGGTFEFHGDVGKRGLRLHAAEKLDDAGNFTCGNEGRSMRDPGAVPLPGGIPLPKGAATHQAVVAVDTDNEFMAQAKIANNTTNASNYLAALFTGLNVFYERDLHVRLVQGTTFLRVAPDSYTQTTLDGQLNEVGTLWKDTPALQAVDRAFVTLLSGKSPNPNGASGFAWLLDAQNYCTSKGQVIQGGDVFGHYSVIQTFKFAGSNASHDVGIVGHELGHNFGAAHTHCTNIATGAEPSANNTIDQCFNGEAGLGCYAGPVSCPNDNSVAGRGSIMSYCNFSGPSGANCGQVLHEFHPTHEVALGVRIAANIANLCLDPIVLQPPDRVFAHGFED